MSSTPNQLHLLRHLLRECTYLPDPIARQWTKAYIIQRYRRYNPDDWTSKRLTRSRSSQASGEPTPSKRSSRSVQRPSTWEEIPDSRRTGLLRAAKAGLRLLCRANTGEMGPLSKILMHTYGRIGRRRRELLAEFLRTEELPGHEKSKLVNASPGGLLATKGSRGLRVSRGAIWGSTGPQGLAGKLRALVTSQQKINHLLIDRLPIRHLKPRLPEKNIWGRSLPVRREKNLRKKWWAMILDRVMPPLPEHEWTTLERLITKAEFWRVSRTRRKMAAGVEAIEHSSLKVPTMYTGNSDSEKYRGRGKLPHNITPRYMRRLWAKIWAQSPILRWDEEKKLWVVKWGRRPASDYQRIVQPLPGSGLGAFFEGVDDTGRGEGSDGKRLLGEVPKRFQKGRFRRRDQQAPERNFEARTALVS